MSLLGKLSNADRKQPNCWCYIMVIDVVNLNHILQDKFGAQCLRIVLACRALTVVAVRSMYEDPEEQDYGPKDN